MRGLVQDIRYAIRVLGKRKGFTIVAALTLALGIGANTTVFSLVDAMVFKPLPVADDKSLVAIYNKDTNTQLGEEDSLSYPDYIDYRDRNEVFSGMIAYGVLDAAVLGKGDQLDLATGDFVSGNYFDVLGVKARMGTTLHAEDDNSSAAPVAVLSYSTWRRRFSADPNIVGRRIDFFNVPFTVVGVLDEKFTGLLKGISPEFWIPLRQQEILFGSDRNHLKDRRNNQLLVMGRLKPGVTLGQAKANMTALALSLGEMYPDTNKSRQLTLIPAKDVIIFPAADRAGLGSSVVLLALAGFVLLIACANLANLLLARASNRRREIAISRELLSRVRKLPGVESASLAGNLPLTFSIHFWGYSLEGPESLPENQWKYADGTLVSDDYFHSMKIPLIEGREFSERDESSKIETVIINETMAKRFWPGRSALGRRIYVNFANHRLAAAEIIGVVADGKYRTLGEQPRPFIYGNLLQNFHGGTLVVRAYSDLQPVFGSIRATVREMDSNIPVFGMQKITERMSIVLLLPQYAAMLFGAFGLLGGALAVVGLYGVVSHSVSQRTHEIGIRMALGGRRGHVLQLVIGEGMLLTAVGLGVGLLLAAATSRFISAILYGIGSTDPLTFAVISLLMIAVAFLACYIPARRASRVDPMVALRYE